MAASMPPLSIIVVTITVSCLATICSSSYTNYAPNDGLRNHLTDHCNPSFADLLSLPTEAIYQFGDSIADTGNLLRADPTDNCANLPYGQTFFNQPTGRFSDGLIMIDYFAKFLNLPFIDPYLNKDGNFSQGVNFAVGGATALDASTLAEKYDISPSTDLSLSVQLSWFKSHLKSPSFIASDQRRKLSKALFFMGEIGGNDYNYAFIKGKTMRDVYKMVPHVLQTIISSVEEIINLGATRIAIPGNLPVGCMTIYLSLFKTNDLTMYDELKCLKKFNKFAQFHNDQLQKSIGDLQRNQPNVTIVYVDYFTALTQILQAATKLGFDKDEVLKACCGIGDNEYNVDINRNCGSEGVPVCEDPNKHVSWDGSHLTQHAYHEMANFLVRHTPCSLPQVA